MTTSAKGPIRQISYKGRKVVYRIEMPPPDFGTDPNPTCVTIYGYLKTMRPLGNKGWYDLDTDPIPEQDRMRIKLRVEQQVIDDLNLDRCPDINFHPEI